MISSASYITNNRERAAALVEFALLLPFLIVVIGATVDFSISGRYESSVIRALGAANRSVLASAGDSLNDDITCAENAGREFLETLKLYGGVHEAGYQHAGISKPAVMSLSVFPVTYLGPGPGEDFPDNMDPVQVSASFTQRCYFCAMTDMVMNMFSARLFQPQVKNSLVSVSQPGGCYPKRESCGSSAPPRDDIESLDWFQSGREIVLDEEGGLWCCSGGGHCSQVGNV